MKNLKFFGIVMMLVMGMSFASCSSDDEEGPSSGSIKENLEGEWFLVNAKWECPEDGNETVIWDYDDQTAEGVCSDEDCGDHQPTKLYIECVAENTYQITEMNYRPYSNSWYEEYTETYELNGNIFKEETYAEGEISYYVKSYIHSLSENELVVVAIEKEIDEEYGTHEDKGTYTYRRNN